MNTKEDASYGIIPFCIREKNIFVFLIQNIHGKFWSFPKGHKEEGEDPFTSALRELKEETGLSAVILDKTPYLEKYSFRHRQFLIKKTVYYYLGEATGEPSLQKEEVLDGKWILLKDAFATLTYPEGRHILEQASPRLIEYAKECVV